MPLTLQTAPAIEPVLLAEAKAHCRVMSTDDDDYIAALIGAAREKVEADTRRSLIEQTWLASFPRFPGGTIIRLEKAPLISVTSVKYYDGNGTEQTFTAYRANINFTPGLIELNYGEVWPSVYSRADAVNILFKAGYGSAAASVPQALRLAVKFLVAHWYTNRQPVGEALADIPATYQNLIGLYEVDLP